MDGGYGRVCSWSEAINNNNLGVAMATGHHVPLQWLQKCCRLLDVSCCVQPAVDDGSFLHVCVPMKPLAEAEIARRWVLLVQRQNASRWQSHHSYELHCLSGWAEKEGTLPSGCWLTRWWNQQHHDGAHCSG